MSGITTNQSEGYNTLLKHYGNWKEAPLDALVLGLYKLQVFYYNEIQRGYAGIGSYSLSSDFVHAAIAVDEVMSISVTQPADIVSKIRGNQLDVSSTDSGEHKELISIISTQVCEKTEHKQDQQVTSNVSTKDGHQKKQEISPTVTPIDGHKENEEANPAVATVIEHEESEEVNPAVSRIDTHEEDQEGNPSDATMDNCEEDQEIHPAAAATTAASYDDVRKSCSVTNEVTQLSRARLDEINIALP